MYIPVKDLGACEAQLLKKSNGAKLLGETSVIFSQGYYVQKLETNLYELPYIALKWTQKYLQFQTIQC